MLTVLQASQQEACMPASEPSGYEGQTCSAEDSTRFVVEPRRDSICCSLFWKAEGASAMAGPTYAACNRYDMLTISGKSQHWHLRVTGAQGTSAMP